MSTGVFLGLALCLGLPAPAPDGSDGLPLPHPAARLELEVGGTPEGCVICDVDGDGRDELLATVRLPGTLLVWTGPPSGWELAPKPTEISIGDWPLGPVALPGTGGTPVAVASRTDDTLVVLTITPGSSVSRRSHPLAARPRVLAAGDLGADGRGEVAVIDTTGRLVLWDGERPSVAIETGEELATCLAFTGDGTGLVAGFQGSRRVRLYRRGDGGPLESEATRTYELDGLPRAIAELDVDADGTDELLVAGGDRWVWILDDESGVARKVEVGLVPLRMRTADMTGDGREELVLLQFGDLSYALIAGLGDPGGLSAIEYAGQDPRDLAIGDLNGDGRPELAFANADARRVGVLFGNAPYGFRQARRVPTGRAPHSIACGDLDGDGRAEAAVLNSLDGTLSVLPNVGGNLRSGAGLRAGEGADHVAVEDLDADGDLDVVWTSRDASGVHLRGALGDGSGELEPLAEAAELVGVREAEGALFRAADGRVEVFIADREAGHLAWFDVGISGATLRNKRLDSIALPAAPRTITPLTVAGREVLAVAMGTEQGRAGMALVEARRTADGGSLIAGEGPRTWTLPIALCAADFDGDGFDDLAHLGRMRPGRTVGMVEVFLQREGGTWKELPTFESGQRPFGIAARDLTGDGRAEIVVSAQNSHHVNLWLPDANTPPRFARAADLGVGTGPLDLLFADLSGDGRLRLLVANAFSNDLSVIDLR
ncbi:MAG: VCBS repeat-containing protein [Planctomycetota bacterium]|jgi:hypothetical protein|nr:VCBS repeat-containing protein [Planctomycetota bacterium]MDP6987929.1 VCBS repeat-containing protein [Planctomycetota bacterium]